MKKAAIFCSVGVPYRTEPLCEQEVSIASLLSLMIFCELLVTGDDVGHWDRFFEREKKMMIWYTDAQFQRSKLTQSMQLFFSFLVH